MSDYPYQSPAITFPPNPTVGQEYIADNGITYTWLSNRWSGVQAIVSGKAQYIIDGEYSYSEYNPKIDKILDGGAA